MQSYVKFSMVLLCGDNLLKFIRYETGFIFYTFSRGCSLLSFDLQNQQKQEPTQNNNDTHKRAMTITIHASQISIMHDMKKTQWNNIDNI